MFDPLSHIDPRLLAYGAGGLAAAAILFWLYGRYRLFTARRSVLAAVQSVAYDSVSDVLISDGMDGLLHLDFVVLTQRGILVLDLRETPGVIFGGDQMNEWTVITRTRRYTFANPQGALLDRIAAVRQVAGDTPVEGRIAFTSRARFPKGRPKSVLMLDSLKVEYAPVDKQSMEAAVAGYQADWERVRQATRPSELKRY
jgi:Nuclease-related domain